MNHDKGTIKPLEIKPLLDENGVPLDGTYEIEEIRIGDVLIWFLLAAVVTFMVLVVIYGGPI